jgi:putative flippase GtrA
MARAIADLYEHVRHLVPELAKFGVVGGIGAVVDLGGAAVLHSAYGVGPLAAKAISITAATAVTYLGSRFWTFRHRENQPVHREAVLFIVLNVIGLIIAEAVIGLTTYGLGLKDPLAYNAASVLGTGLGTIFRFYAYRKWVFLAPAEQPASLVPAGSMPGELDYAPWELDPSFFDQASVYSPKVRLEDPLVPNGRVTSPLVHAAAPAGEAALRETQPWESTPWESPVRDTAEWESASWDAPQWESPAWETPDWDSGSPWEAPRPMSADRSVSDAGQRAPGRHRKR